MITTADMRHALMLAATIVACKQVDPPTRPTGLEPTPFDDILPGFDDPGTYAIPTHTRWTLDDPLRYARTLELHDFDGDGRVELVVGARASTGSNGDFPGPDSGVFWAEDALSGGRLEDARQILWSGTERGYGDVGRIGDALVVAGGPNDDGTFLSVFTEGWAPAFADATFTLAGGGVFPCDLNEDGTPDLCGTQSAIAGPVDADSEVQWSWPPIVPSAFAEGADHLAMEFGPGLGQFAFLPKPIPPGTLEDLGPFAWAGPEGHRLATLGSWVPGVGAWLIRAYPSATSDEASWLFLHPGVTGTLGTVTSMHAGVWPTGLATEGDFDGDGVDEVVLSSADSGGRVFVSIFRTPLPAVTSEQDAWVRLHLPSGAESVRALRVADVDDDGRDDLGVLYAHEGDGHRVAVITADDLLDRVPPAP